MAAAAGVRQDGAAVAQTESDQHAALGCALKAEPSQMMLEWPNCSEGRDTSGG